jgi:hypothetical protein
MSAQPNSEAEMKQLDTEARVKMQEMLDEITEEEIVEEE